MSDRNQQLRDEIEHYRREGATAIHRLDQTEAAIRDELARQRAESGKGDDRGA